MCCHSSLCRSLHRDLLDLTFKPLGLARLRGAPRCSRVVRRLVRALAPSRRMFCGALCMGLPVRTPLCSNAFPCSLLLRGMRSACSAVSLYASTLAGRSGGCGGWGGSACSAVPRAARTLTGCPKGCGGCGGSACSAVPRAARLVAGRSQSVGRRGARCGERGHRPPRPRHQPCEGFLHVGRAGARARIPRSAGPPQVHDALRAVLRNPAGACFLGQTPAGRPSQPTSSACAAAHSAAMATATHTSAVPAVKAARI